MRKNRILAAILLAAMVCSLSFTTVLAVGDPVRIKDKPDDPVTGSDEIGVRVNGYLIDFPDEKPFVDENNRTMIPVRFVGEALGADVSWDGKAKGAVIEKDGVKIVLPIGTNTMIVTRGGAETTKTLDTKAVLQNGRTFVPIRAIAEELGAWVGYSSAYNTAEIYSDVLTPAEIEELHSLPVRNYWVQNVADYNKPVLKGNTVYEDLSEYVLRNDLSVYDYELVTPGGLYFNTKNSTQEEKIDFICQGISEGMAENYTSEMCGINATFRTDASCLFTNPAGNSNYLNYGYVTINVGKDADIKTYCMLNNNSDLDFSFLQPGKTYTFILETNWTIFIGKSFGLTRMATYNRTNGVDERWG